MKSKSNWIGWKKEQKRKKMVTFAVIATDAVCMIALALPVIFSGLMPQ